MKPARETDDGPAEMGRLFEEALRCLESTDLSGANAALKKAYAEAAFSRNAAEPTGYVGAGDGVESRKIANGSEDRR